MTSIQTAIEIRKAGPRDVPSIFSFIRKLAEYEQLSHKMAATEEDLHDALFGPRPLIEALIADLDGEPVGFALYFEVYSTFRGRRGVYLEDIFVEPAHRRRGVGSALLAEVAKEAKIRGSWLQWLVLDWNRLAIEFYERRGAKPVEDWKGYRLEGEALDRLARG